MRRHTRQHWLAPLAGLVAILALSACGRLTAGVVTRPEGGHGIEAGQVPTYTPMPTPTEPIDTEGAAGTATPPLLATPSPDDAAAEEGEPVEAWQGEILVGEPGTQFVWFVRDDGERYDIGATDNATRGQIVQARLNGARVRLWGRLFYGEPAAEARHIEVTGIEWLGETVNPAPTVATSEEGEPVEAWEGVLVKLAPGSQFGQYFERSDGERYDIGASDDATRAQLEQARWSGARIRIWGRIYYGVPATEARHVEVSRVEALTLASTEARNLSPFARPDATSNLPSDRYGSYGAFAAIDGALETAWVEGVADEGLGQSLNLTFPQEVIVDRVAISAGYDASAALWSGNNRIRRAMLLFSQGQQVPVDLADVRGLQTVEVGGIATTWVKLVIEEVYPGTGTNDTCVAELEVWGRTH